MITFVTLYVSLLVKHVWMVSQHNVQVVLLDMPMMMTTSNA